MEALDKFFAHPLVKTAITFVVSGIIMFILGRIGASQKRHKSKKLFNLSKLILNCIRAVVVVATIFVILQNFGVDISSILATAGVVSVIVGLALQDAMKDIIAGANILADNYFSPGDVVRIGNYEGKIINIGLKVTKLRLLDDGSEVTIANRNITESTRVSANFAVDVNIAAGTSHALMTKVCETILKKVQALEIVKGADYLGVQDLDGDTATVRFDVNCVRTEVYPRARRETLGIIKAEFDKNKIELK